MTEPLKPWLRVSGGDPAGFPNFRPLNKIRREPRKPRFIVQPLYQVWVRDTVRGDIPVTPKMPLGAAEEFAVAVREQIRQGHEKVWSSPSVLPVL